MRRVHHSHTFDRLWNFHETLQVAQNEAISGHKRSEIDILRPAAARRFYLSLRCTSRDTRLGPCHCGRSNHPKFLHDQSAESRVSFRPLIPNGAFLFVRQDKTYSYLVHIWALSHVHISQRCTNVFHRCFCADANLDTHSVWSVLVMLQFEVHNQCLFPSTANHIFGSTGIFN